MATKDDKSEVKVDGNALAQYIGGNVSEEVQSLLEDLREAGRAAQDGKAPKKSEEKKYRNVKVERHAEGIITLPIGMSYATGREWLTKMEKDEEQAVAIYHDFEAFALDGARAFWNALKELYGFVDTKPSWFSTTTMVNVEIAPGVFESVAWGEMQPPGIDGILKTDMDFNGEVPKFIIRGEVRKKHVPAIEAIARKTRENLLQDSIYRGKAIRVNLAFMTGEERFNTDRHAPKFIDLRGRREDELIVDETTELLLRTELWSRIEMTEKLRKAGVRIKHGVIFSGPFGVGKTLASEVTAMKATKEGRWTYIYLSAPNQLPVGIKFARLFGPVVLFAEDVDAAVRGQERDELINLVLNSMDGMDNKGQDIIVVLTTNDVAAINQGFLRAGRTDGIVVFHAPDGPTSREFLRKVLGDSLSPDADLEELGDDWKGVIPAFLSEAANKARTFALVRTGGNIKGQVTIADLKAVRSIMDEHIKMVTGVKPRPTISVTKVLRDARYELPAENADVSSEYDGN